MIDADLARVVDADFGQTREVITLEQPARRRTGAFLVLGRGRQRQNRRATARGVAVIRHGLILHDVH